MSKGCSYVNINHLFNPVGYMQYFSLDLYFKEIKYACFSLKFF